jgi:hypothetical protein
MMPPAFFCDKATMAWLSIEAVRMWASHGPGHTLVGPICHLPFVTIALRQDYLTGHRLMLRILTVAEARGYEPDTSQAHFLNTLGTGHWFVALEDNVGWHACSGRKATNRRHRTRNPRRRTAAALWCWRTNTSPGPSRPLCSAIRGS